MVVDHHDVSFQRFFARFQHEALLVVRAVAAQAVFATGGNVAPDAGVFRHAVQLGFIAGAAGFGKAAHFFQVRHVLPRHETAIFARAFKVVMAHVIGAALEQGDGSGHIECVAYRWQVAAEQLVLQVFGAGGNDHLATVQQRRRQVGQGFAGAGAGFGDQYAVGFDGVLDGARQRQLLGA